MHRICRKRRHFDARRWLYGRIFSRELSATAGIIAAHLQSQLPLGGLYMKPLLIAGTLAAFAASSAFAQTTTVSSDYYVVRDATTKRCTIVDSKPTTTTTTVVDNGTFKTRTEAETGMKTMKICTEN
jgi:hypothetical protein